MDETAEFVTEVVPRLRRAETALHNGDAGPRMAMWSRNEPLTLMGAAFSGTGWAEIQAVFMRLGSSFADCSSYDIDVVAAEACGGLAYIVAFEHTTASIDGVPRTYTLRATTVFRREDGGWKVVHRHGDALASTASGEPMQRPRAEAIDGSSDRRQAAQR